MMTKHTPGPWTVDTSDWPLIINGPDDSVIACLPLRGEDLGTTTEATEYQTMKDARLIAAAPDMRDYLAALVGAIDRKGYEDLVLTEMANEVCALLARIDDGGGQP